MSYNVVAKFGGTSVKTPAAIRKVAEIITSDANIRTVVVSAVGGVTNLLVEFCKADKIARTSLKDRLLSIHLNLIAELELELEEEINGTLGQLNEIQVVDAKSIDRIVSIGEDLSSLIVTAYLQKQGVDGMHLDARLFMLTDEHYGKATPQLDQIKAYSFPQRLFITQGFIGSTAYGDTTTLGRGGSDYSAALIAEAMDADELLIYTDVPGVYTSDPNRIHNAQLIPELTFQEMAEMANFGAKVLHPATLEPCVRAKIPIRILSTFDHGKPGTLVRVEDSNLANDVCIRAITMRTNQILITIKSLKMLNVYGFLSNIFDILAYYKISVDLITTSEVSVALTIDNANIGSHNINPFMENKSLLSELKKFAEIVIEEDLTLIAIVGYGLTVPGFIQKILEIIKPYKIRLVCYGASNSSIGILVPKISADEVANLLHKELLEGKNV